MKPNLFRIATKELSQDAFFTWLLQWADAKNKAENPSLHQMATEFTKFLIAQQFDTDGLTINSVEAGRQWKYIDIYATVNDDYIIIIEDKTNSREHAGQLERYKETVKAAYPNDNFRHVFIYLKTGNEDMRTLKEIRKKGYAVVDRRSVLNVFAGSTVESDIFNEFNLYLSHIEEQTNAYLSFTKLKSSYRAAEGFYMRLQEIIPGWTGWKYVSNPTGGFLGFFYHYNGSEDYTLYIQIENSLRGDLKVVVKIDEWDGQTATLYKMLGALQPFAKKYGLELVKPDRYKAGGTSTLAVLRKAFRIDTNDQLDVENFVATLGNLEKTLNEFIETDKAKDFQTAL